MTAAKKIIDRAIFEIEESTPDQIRAGAKRFSFAAAAQARMRATSPDTSPQVRAALYREERAAMRAAARQGHMTQINSLLRFIANHDPEAATPRAEIQPNNHRYSPSEKPWAGMFDSPYRPATYSK